jgi:hypothetical protein
VKLAIIFDSCAVVNNLEREGIHYIDSCAVVKHLEREASHYV